MPSLDACFIFDAVWAFQFQVQLWSVWQKVRTTWKKPTNPEWKAKLYFLHLSSWSPPPEEKYNIYNVVIWFGETFISLGECVINCKCYLIQRILSPGKVKVRSVLKLWSIFTLLSDLENAVIWSSQLDHSFGTRFFHYGFSFTSNSVISVSYLVYVCYGPWLYWPWGRSADGREANGGEGDRDPWS